MSDWFNGGTWGTVDDGFGNRILLDHLPGGNWEIAWEFECAGGFNYLSAPRNFPVIWEMGH